MDLYQLDRGWTLDMLKTMNGDMFNALGVDLNWPQGWDANPVNRIVRDDELWSTLNQRVVGVSGVALVRAQVICQQMMWQGRGPEGDKLPKTLRKLWYAGHKEALQHISRRLDIWRAGEQMNDVAANLRQVSVWEHWQPFSKWTRNAQHQEVVEYEESTLLDNLRFRPITFDRVEFS